MNNPRQGHEMESSKQSQLRNEQVTQIIITTQEPQCCCCGVSVGLPIWFVLSVMVNILRLAIGQSDGYSITGVVIILLVYVFCAVTVVTKRTDQMTYGQLTLAGAYLLMALLEIVSAATFDAAGYCQKLVQSSSTSSSNVPDCTAAVKLALQESCAGQIIWQAIVVGILIQRIQAYKIFLTTTTDGPPQVPSKTAYT